MATDKNILHKLAYAKSLLVMSAQLSSSPSLVSSSLGVVISDSALESIFKTVFLHKDVDQRKLNKKFVYLPDMVAYARGTDWFPELKPNFNELLQIHEVRNAIQHSGILQPSDIAKDIVGQAVSNAAKVCEAVFGIKWQEISTGELFKDSLTKNLFEEAEKAFYTKDFKRSAYALIGCFERARFVEQTSIFGSGITLARFDALSSNSSTNLREILDYIGKVHFEVEILKLRLDYKSYMKFREISNQLTPFYGAPNVDTEGVEAETVISNVKRLVEKDVEQWDISQIEHQWLPFAFSFVQQAILTWEGLERAGWTEAVGALLSYYLSHYT